MQFAKFLAARLLTYVLVVWVGITIVFFVPRFIPGNPVEAMLGKLMSQGTTMDPKLVEEYAPHHDTIIRVGRHALGTILGISEARDIDSGFWAFTLLLSNTGQ